MRLSSYDDKESEISRKRRSRNLIAAGLALFVLPVAGMEAKRLFDRFFSLRAQPKFETFDPRSVPSVSRLPDLPPQAPAPPAPAPASATSLPPPPAAAPTLEVVAKTAPESKTREAGPKAVAEAEKGPKPFKMPKFKPMIPLSDLNLGRQADYTPGLKAKLSEPLSTPKIESPPAPTSPLPRAPAAPPAPKPAPQNARVISLPISQAQLRSPPPAPTGELVAAQPTKSASPVVADPGAAIIMAAPDTPPPPNPERPLTRNGPCPHPAWWKNSYSDVCYSTVEACRGSANGNGDCAQGAH